MKKIALFFCLLTAAVFGWSQDDNSTVFLTQSNNGQTFTMVTLADNYMLNLMSESDGSGNYTDGPYDRWIAVDSGTCEGETGMSFQFVSFDIDPGDTLFIYDGPSTSYPILLACNNSLNPQVNTTVFPSPVNASGFLTLRFKTNGDGINGKGFMINVHCREKCETVVPVIDSFYYKTRNGVIIDTQYLRPVMQIDTNWVRENIDGIWYNTDSFTLDTIWFSGVHLCKGEGVIFNGHGQYTNYYGYGPSDISTMFEWNFGNGKDSSGINLKQASTFYRDLDCYDVTLRITDIKGCKSTIMETVRVRISQNPIKTIYDLNPICTTDSSIVNVGYEGGNASITMQKIKFDNNKSKTIDCKTFVPDGANVSCPQGDADKCFSAPITFDDFPPGRTVQSASDICSICINVEHEFLGDIGGRIICPTKQKAILWYGTSGKDPLLPTSQTARDTMGIIDGMYGGGGRYLGLPYGGNDHHTYDEKSGGDPALENQTSKYCDSVCNMYGVGFDYCFSRNGEYLLRHGDPCDKTEKESKDYFCYTADDDTTVTYTFPVIPAPYALAGQSAETKVFSTKKPSKHDGKFDYYLPVSDFSELIGCPLNGDWEIQLCDNYGIDNGWIFSWSLDFCGIRSGVGCEYQVAIDSVIWEPDSAYGDFDLGRWRGLNIEKRTDTRSIISAHDTAGYFPINVRIYDEFGCEWDTTTAIRSVWAPTPTLGNDTVLCDVETLLLDAKDRHTDTNYIFAWEPFGQKTDTVETRGMLGSSTLYTVDVTHKEWGITCPTRDSIRVNINHQPLPNFDPGVYPLEGCEPYTIHFENTSQYGDYYFWDFGDGDTSSAKSPTHTYGTGQYNFRYIVSTEHGCRDSLVYEDLVTVYSSPVAQFSWEPMNPTVMHPEVTFNNLTIPQSDENKYYWEIQYDRDNKVSYHTLRDVNPTFQWETDGSDISGNYVVRLIAMTENLGPSGNIVECRDTIENSILLVNDFLQFPSAVTPNGDGYNDKFIIRNLLEGLGYPNNSLAIYDRWGKRIFYKENISKEEDFWDPAADNTPTGTYFWRFTGKGYLGDIQRNGVVEIIK